MKWETPAYRDISMSSEIGAYQDDFEERSPIPSDHGQATPAQALDSEG
jgi:hypothetical protein